MQFNTQQISELINGLSNLQVVISNLLLCKSNNLFSNLLFQMPFNFGNTLSYCLDQEYKKMHHTDNSPQNYNQNTPNNQKAENNIQCLNYDAIQNNSHQYQNILNQNQKTINFKQEFQQSKKIVSKKRRQRKTHPKEDQDYEPDYIQKSELLPKISYDTKNIIKIFSRGMATYILNDKKNIKPLLEKHGVSQLTFYKYINRIRGKVENIIQLRQMWQDQEDKLAKIMRIISLDYLRKRHLHHIFNSKVRLIFRNLKYRHKFYEGLKKPVQFNTMKDYLKKQGE